MYNDEKQVKKSVCREFGIDTKNAYQFELFFKEAESPRDESGFEEGVIYRLWVGKIEQAGIAVPFAVQLDKAPIEISEDFYLHYLDAPDAWTFMHTDGKMYNLIYCSNGAKTIVPTWWLDVSRVKKHAVLPAGTPWGFEYRGDGKRTFFAWVFHPKDSSPKIFNMEDGGWYTEEQAFVAVPIKSGICQIKTLKLFCDKGIIRKG